MTALFIPLKNIPHIHKGTLLYFNSGDHTVTSFDSLHFELQSVVLCSRLYSWHLPELLLQPVLGEQACAVRRERGRVRGEEWEREGG